MDIKAPSPTEIRSMVVIGVLAAVAIGVIMAIAEILSEQDAIHQQMSRVELTATELAALFAEANSITRRAAEEG